MAEAPRAASGEGVSRRSLRRDGHGYAEQGHASCPRLVKRCAAGADCDGECNECEECDGLVAMTRTGEADDVNDFNGGTPGWEEVELERFGAPPAFSLAARRSADDERRHARAVGTLADRVSAPRLSIERAPLEERSLAEVALDNAVEGEIRETFGTFVAAMQAERAASAAVRRAYASIAADEARHALLSFALDDWMLPQLSSRERAGIEASKRERAAQFSALVTEPSADLALLLGLPDATRSMDLLALVAG